MTSAVFLKLGGWSDVCLANFMGNAFKEKFVESSTTLVTDKSLRDWTSCLNFDHVIFVDAASDALERWPSIEIVKLILKLRLKNFEYGFNLHQTPLYDRYLKRGGVEKIFSLSTLTKSRSDLESYLELLAQAQVFPKKLNFRINVRRQVHEEMMRRLASLELRAQNYIVIAPGGRAGPDQSFLNLRWNHYAELIRLVCERTSYPILLVGDATERSLALTLSAVSPARVKSLVGEISREEATAVMSEAFAFIGNDSGPAHVAGSIGIPGVILFGPTSSKKRGPPGKDKSVICIDGVIPCSPCAHSDPKTWKTAFDWNCKDNACMKSISPEQAWKAFAQATRLPTLSP